MSSRVLKEFNWLLHGKTFEEEAQDYDDKQKEEETELLTDYSKLFEKDNEELTQLKNQVSEQEKELSQLKEELTEKDEEIAELTQKIMVVSQTIDSQQEHINELIALIEKKEQQPAVELVETKKCWHFW